MVSSLYSTLCSDYFRSCSLCSRTSCFEISFTEHHFLYFLPFLTRVHGERGEAVRIRDTGLFIVAFIEVHSICVTVGHLGRYSLTVYHSGELESNNVNRKCILQVQRREHKAVRSKACARLVLNRSAHK